MDIDLDLDEDDITIIEPEVEDLDEEVPSADAAPKKPKRKRH